MPLSKSPTATNPTDVTLGIHKGTVLNFFDDKGWGWIRPDLTGSVDRYQTRPRVGDVYVHFTAIESDRKRRTLKLGQRVEFELRDGARGLYAASVKVVTH